MSGIMYRNKLLFFVLFMHFSFVFACSGQSIPQAPQPSFFAIIVSDLDTSLTWYQQNFGFELLNKVESEERGFRQANIQNGTAKIELIELQKSVLPESILESLPSGTKLTGFFKIGFTVNNLDRWYHDLITSGANLFGSIVKDPNTGQRMIIVRDPDGNRIQLFEKIK